MKAFGIDPNAACTTRRTRRQLRSASLLASLLASGGATAATPPVWQGQFFVTDATPPCAPSASTADFGTAVFAPQLTPGPRTPGDSLAFFFPRYAVAIGVDRNKPSRAGTDGSLRGENPVIADAVTSHARSDSRASFAYLVIYPQSITADTKQIVIKGAVNGFFGVPGCTLGFKANLLPQP